MSGKVDGDNGWVDLCLTFAEAGLTVPPIPKDHRQLLVREQKWFWSTRPDVDSFQMYMFGYVEELLSGSIDDYSAVSHQGHGINSYSLNVSIVKSPVAVIFQHSWGGAYSNPMRDITEVAACFFEIRELLIAAAAASKSQPNRDGVAHILSWSDFRDTAAYYAKDKNGCWSKEEGRPCVRYDPDERRAGNRDYHEEIGTACRRFLLNLSAE